MDSVTTSTANRIYVKYSYDFQGRVIATHTPAPHTTPVADGLDFGNYSYTSNFYDSATGRLAYTDRSTSVASGVERRTYTYNSLGQVIATTPQSLYSNETQTGLVSGSSTYYEEMDNEWYRTSVSYLWTQTNSTACTTTSVSRTRIATADNRVAQASSLSAFGISGNNIVQTSLATSTDIHENVYTNMTFLDASSATKWQISASSLSAYPSIQKTIAGYPVMTVSSLGATNTFTYDGFARQVSATTTREASPDVGVLPLGTPSPSSAIVTQVTSNFYNSVGQLSSVSTPLGTLSNGGENSALITTYEYNSLGRLFATSSGQQGSTSFQLVAGTTNTYNAVGQLIAQYGSTYPVAYEYDSQGRKIKMTTFSNPNNPAETQWLYDEPTGLLTNKVYDDGNGPTYSYYPNGQLKTRIGARGLVSSNAYNIAGQLISTTYSDGTPTITKEYNRLGQPIVVTDAQGTRTFNYDTNTFVLISESINGTNILTYSYDKGRQTGYTSGYAEHQLRNYLVFDQSGRIASQQAVFGSETNTFHFNYLQGSAMVSSITNNLGFGVSKYYEDSRNLTTCISNYFGSSPISSFIYENDAIGRRSQRVDNNIDYSVAITNTFAYNGYSEVTNAVMNTDNYNFTFDDIGNREDYSLNNGSVEYDCNSVNQYVNKSFSSMGTNFFTSYHHDSDGNLVDYSFSYNDGSGSQQQFAWIYTWNAENRLTSVTNYLNDVYVTYKYDYQGRMFEKVTNGVTNNFVWNGNHIVAEFTDSSTNLYTWSQGETLTASLDGETVFYCHDANKNITDLVDDSGTHLVHYEYSPFGVQSSTVYSSPFTVSLNPFRFSNEYFDEDTGFVEYKFRPYIPPLGKFASRDPIGVQGGLNEYAICANDLINKFDLWGKISVKISEKTEYRHSVKHNKLINFYVAEIKQIGKLDKKSYLNVLQLKYVNGRWSIDTDTKYTFPYYFLPAEVKNRSVIIDGSSVLEFADGPGGSLSGTVFFYMMPVEISLKCYKDPFYRIEANTKILAKKFWGYNLNTGDYYYSAANNIPDIEINNLSEDKLKDLILKETDPRAYKYTWPYLFNFKVIME